METPLRMLRSYVAVEGETLSGVELVLADALGKAGMEVRCNVTRRMPGGRKRKADIRCDDLPLIFQVESRLWHPAAVNEEDVQRDREWRAAGFTTVRVSAWRIRSELDQVVDEAFEAARSLHRQLGA